MKATSVFLIRVFLTISLCVVSHTGAFSAAYDFSSIPDNTWVQLNPQLYNHLGQLVATGSADPVTQLTYPNYRFPFNAFSGFVYNSDSASILMFGGGGHGGRWGNDVWEYDIADNKWRQHYAIEPQANYPNQGDGIGLSKSQYAAALANGQWQPPGSTSTGKPWTSHSYDQLAYDPVNHEMLFHGPNYAFGYDINYYLQIPSAWAYNSSSKSWRSIADDLSTKRQMGAMEYYPPTQKVILKIRDDDTVADVIWSYDTSSQTWTRVGDAGRTLRNAVMVYDNINQQLLMFGSDYPASDVLWAYKPETNTWTQKATNSATRPPAGASAAAFDSQHGVLIIWGTGETGSAHSTWAYHTETDQWQAMNANNEPPSNRGHVFGHMAFDPVRNVVIMVDGGGFTWAYRFSNSGEPGDPPPDTVPPAVEFTTPPDGASNYPVSVPITVSFSEDMDSSSLSSSTFTVRSGGNNVPGTVTPNSDSATFVADDDLAHATTYSVTISTDVADLAGNSLPENYNFAFATQEEGSSSFVIHTDPVPETVLPKPAVGLWITDPDFGGQIMRMHGYTDSGDSGRHVYSDMTAWSPNMVYYVLTTDDTGITVFNWPERTPARTNLGLGTATYFYSKVDDNTIYYFSGTRLRKYDVASDTKSTVHDFSGVFSSLKPECMKPTSDNGRYMAIPGIRSGGSGGVVRYDFQTDTVGAMISRGTETETGISPNGDYVVYIGSDVKAYDPVTGALAGTITTASTPHCDVFKDSAGTQWLVYDGSNREGAAGGVWKSRIPDGGVDRRLMLTWQNMHISCRQRSGDWCIMSTYSVPEDRALAFGDEIVRVYLDSDDSNPHIERMAHHRSRSLGPGGSPNCYWKQPHASATPDGQYVIFASSWHEDCIVEPVDRTDPYLLLLQPGGSGELGTPTNLRPK